MPAPSVDAVPLLDLTRQHRALEAELLGAFTRVLRSGHYVLGREVRRLEEECARLLGARHAIGTSSGTDSLLLALMALGVGPGDEVVCPTYTFFATAGAVARVGATPVFVDSTPCCFACDPDAVARALGPRTRAVLVVHLFGQPAELGVILRAAGARGIPVIEDAAQALGAAWRGRAAGTLGTFGAYSFFPSKNLGALGDGGLLTTDDDALAERARVLRAHGARPKYHHPCIGGNFRLDEVQAALLAVKLPHLRTWSAARSSHARRYTERLVDAGAAEVTPSRCRGESGRASAGAPLLAPASCRDHIHNQYVLRARTRQARDALREHLARRNVGTEVYYPLPMHEQPCFASLGYARGDFPEAEAAADTTVALPVFPELDEAEVDHVVRSILEIAPALPDAPDDARPAPRTPSIGAQP